jgi:hypothetical protein
MFLNNVSEKEAFRTPELMTRESENEFCWVFFQDIF